MLCHHGSCLQYFKQCLFFQTIYPLKQILSQTGEPELVKSLHSDIKDAHALNSHLGILQAIFSSKPYVLLSRNQTTWRLRINKISGLPRNKLQSWYSLQTIFPHDQKNLIRCFRPKRDSYMLLSFHLDTKDGHALNSLLGTFQTTSSNMFLKEYPFIFSWAETYWDASCNM